MQSIVYPLTTAAEITVPVLFHFSPRTNHTLIHMNLQLHYMEILQNR